MRVDTVQSGAMRPALYASGPMASNPTPGQAAREFEAMLIAQLIRAAREAGVRGEERSLAGADNYLEFAEKHLAEALADSGAFGFARMILRSLDREAKKQADEPSNKSASRQDVTSSERPSIPSKVTKSRHFPGL